MATHLSDYAQELARLGEQGFLKTHHRPVLIVQDVVGILEGEGQADLGTTLLAAPALGVAERLQGLVGRVFPLAKAQNAAPGPIFVGRDADSDVRIPESSISKRHCFLRIEGTGVTVTDTGSRNGTAVNGVKLPPKRPVPITPGDKLTLGRFVLVLQDARGLLAAARQSARPA